MKKRTFDEMVSYFNRKVADMEIDRKYKMELLGMITAILQEHDSTIKPEQRWIPCGERLPEFRHVINPDPEEDSGWDESPFVLVCFDDGDIECRQFIREDGMVSIYPEEFRGRKATAWMPLPEPYREEATDETP